MAKIVATTSFRFGRVRYWERDLPPEERVEIDVVRHEARRRLQDARHVFLLARLHPALAGTEAPDSDG